MTPDQYREILREELQPLERRVGGLEDAVLVLADHMPGNYPGQPAHVRTRVEVALGRRSE